MQTLRELRKAKGISMKELGDIVGVAESTISQYETGKRSPDFKTLSKFGKFFKVTTDYILGYDLSAWENIVLPPIITDAYNLICTQLLNIARIYGLEDIYSELKTTTPSPDRLKDMARRCHYDAETFQSLSKNCIEQSVVSITDGLPLSITDTEQILIDNFRSLNEEGQEKIIDYTDDLFTSGKYIKSRESEMDSKRQA